MMRNTKRAWRRHHYRRIQRARARYWNHGAARTEKTRGLVESCPCRCSGPCCGNPRRHFGEPTVQERRQASGAPIADSWNA